MAGVKNVVFLLITLMLMTLVTHVCIADTSSGQLLINNNNNKLIDNNRERESRETRDAQSWYSALTLFCCMTVYQIVTERIARHTQIFSPHIFSFLNLPGDHGYRGLKNIKKRITQVQPAVNRSFKGRLQITS